MPSPQRPRLISLTYSPWSEKARWALEHHGIIYDRTSYQPLVDEPALRLRTGKLRGPMTVPVLHDSTGWLLDSWDIARWADRVGTGTKLFPPDELQAVVHLNALSERGLESGRALGLTRMVRQPRWLAAMVPPAMRKPLGPLGPRLAGLAMRRTLRKYGAGKTSQAQHRTRLHGVLQSLRDRLAAQSPGGGAPATLLGHFTYADIAAAQVLQFVDPKNLGHFKLAPEGQHGYRDPDLAREFADLCAWREQLYAHYHPRHARSR